jgi:hypothetical protein
MEEERQVDRYVLILFSIWSSVLQLIRQIIG